MTARPLRSVLYIPGDKPRALEKARGLPVDAIIFDLEDAVAPDAKSGARETLVAALGQGYGARACLVRINGFDTEWGEGDLDAIAAASPEAVLLPKVNGPGDVADLADRLAARPETANTQIWAMMETCEGVLNAAAIARAPRMAGFILGTNDLAKEIGCATGGDRMAMMVALQTCLMAARAAGIACVDGVYNAFKDDDGLASECEQGRALGMDGKTLIHPAQVATANAAFAPTPEAVELANRQIAAYEAALAAGQGVAVLDGRIVENLHIVTARATLAKAAAIATLETQ
ncbi:HpcH/HpaI aldolase/citrate lyase family protein [Oceaniglobus ichthyenteri]|uniref:HpcH/HpaI aldolase/citrate lyase family protein n=1 Tax=Oceaniglobus ichthyenteri TaxID=2136177 RepID=UPI000D36E148|nr:CoA ester lyase [Oceaniglobus ichthyenteri]